MSLNDHSTKTRCKPERGLKIYLVPRASRDATRTVHISWDVHVHECLFLSACGTQDFAEKQWIIKEVTWMIAGQADQCAGLNISSGRAGKKQGRKAGRPAASERVKTLYQFRGGLRILNVKTDSPQKALSKLMTSDSQESIGANKELGKEDAKLNSRICID